MKHKCPNPKCQYEWEARVRKPKQCPLCKRYLPLVKMEQELDKRNEGRE